ncbi:MAG: SDR family oxidoreductase [bacterium]|nr:SDR family oxidoreductase [bacterium]
MASVLVTGANRGIGLELVRQLKSRGDEVIAVCRQQSQALDRIGVEVIDGVDVSDDRVGGILSEVLGRRSLDIVINNAGVLTQESLEDLDWERIRRQFEVNALGPIRVTSALLPNLVTGSKVAIVTSRMGSIEDNTSGSRYGYRMSKAAVNMAGRSLAHDLKARGIAVVILHPGYVRTEMTDGQGLIDPPESATGLIARIDELTMTTTGTFRHSNGEALPW